MSENHPEEADRGPGQFWPDEPPPEDEPLGPAPAGLRSPGEPPAWFDEAPMSLEPPDDELGDPLELPEWDARSVASDPRDDTPSQESRQARPLETEVERSPFRELAVDAEPDAGEPFVFPDVLSSGISNDPWIEDPSSTASFKPVEYVPETTEETVRRSGLAYSVGVVFFASVAFSMVLGWFADLVLGTAPWGLVGGIVLGSIIGFVQFFRISRKIFNTDGTERAIRPLLSHEDEEK